MAQDRTVHPISLLISSLFLLAYGIESVWAQQTMRRSDQERPRTSRNSPDLLPPDIPVIPTAPTAPNRPTPTTPATPATPTTPATPATPASPDRPIPSVIPASPDRPLPAVPATPVLVILVTPVTPAMPATPATPVGPFCPAVPLTTSNSPASSNSWDRVWQQIIRRRDQDKPRTSRGLICPVIPQLMNQRVVWRDRPIFVWQGKAEMLSVSDFTNPQQPVWTRDRLENTNSVIYAGSPLKPGTRYIWKAETGTESSQVIFQTLEKSAHDQISTQLMQLETQLNQQKVTPEERLRQRVQFFLNQNLFLDAIQELYTLPQPSPKLKNIQEKLAELSCPTLH